MRKVTLADRYPFLAKAAIRDSLACWSLDKDAEFNPAPAFISWALLNVSSDALRELEGDISQGHSLFDDVAITF
jgi:hypothetical protein